MNEDCADIPVFPLPMVACPSEIIPLHIFEPRYREMVSWCRSRLSDGLSGDFGIFFVSDRKTAAVGSTARIRTILREYGDGRVDLLAIGQRRCRILERRSDHAYDTARVEFVGDAADDWSEDVATEAFELHRTLIHLVTGTCPADGDYEGTCTLSYRMAPSAALPSELKQAFLETRCENDRLQILIDHMKELILQIQGMQVAARAIKSQWDLQAFLKKGQPGRTTP
jgi:Lon protease-like protein